MAIAKMLDRDVRLAVRNKVIKDHIADPSTLVIEEMGVNHGRNRVDIAVINGEIHGYELKSDSDNLLRLPQQARAYSSVMDKVTLVIGSKHAHEAVSMIPEWWGIKIAEQGKRGGIKLHTERRNKKNRNIDSLELLKLVWKEEVNILLSQKIDVDWRIKSLRKKEIYQLVVDNFTIDEIQDNVRVILKNRVNWRSDERQE